MGPDEFDDQRPPWTSWSAKARSARPARPPTRLAASPRAVYEATDQGVARFDHWIGAPPSEPDVRDELHLRIATARPENLDRLIEITYEQERACLERLQAHTGRASFGEVLARGGSWEAVAALIVRDAEVMHLEATMDWLARAREAMLWVQERPQGVAPDWD